MATTDGDPIFVDTNVLVYASVTSAPLHQVALRAIVDREQAGDQMWISRQVLREYLAVLTRPQTFANPIPISTLTAQVRAFESRFRIAEEGANVTSQLLSILGHFNVGGKQIHDANIVATMQVNGIGSLLTHNVSDFSRFSSLVQVLPIL
jgi:predicted nucleic acid-binding protein